MLFDNKGACILWSGVVVAQLECCPQPRRASHQVVHQAPGGVSHSPCLSWSPNQNNILSRNVTTSNEICEKLHDDFPPFCCTQRLPQRLGHEVPPSWNQRSVVVTGLTPWTKEACPRQMVSPSRQCGWQGLGTNWPRVHGASKYKNILCYFQWSENQAKILKVSKRKAWGVLCFV